MAAQGGSCERKPAVSTMEVPEEIRIRLIAGVADPVLRAADGAELRVPSRMGRKALRDLVHHLLDCPSPRPDLHFLGPDGACLRTTLAKFVARRSLSTETNLSLTYYVPMPPPQRPDPVDASQEWLADISAFGFSSEVAREPLLVAASYSGCPIISSPASIVVGEEGLQDGAHKAPVKGVTWLARGNAFVTAGQDGVAKLWSFEDSSDLGVASAVVAGVFRSEDVAAPCPFECTAACNISGRDVVALGGSNGSVWILDDVSSASDIEKAGEAGDRAKRKRADTVSLVARHLGVSSPDLGVTTLEWDGGKCDGSLVSSGLDGMVRVWDASAGAVSLSVPGGGKAISGLAVSRKCYLVAAADGVVRVLDGREGGGVVGVTGKGKGHSGMATDVTWMSEDESFASGGLDGSVRAWDMRSYEAPVHIVEGVHGRGARSLGLACAFHESRTAVFSAGEDGKIQTVSFSAK